MPTLRAAALSCPRLPDTPRDAVRPGVEMRGLRLAFSITLLLGGLFSPGAAEAQHATTVARVGYLALDLATAPHLHEAFRQGLRDFGYVEGHNVAIEFDLLTESSSGSPLSRPN